MTRAQVFKEVEDIPGLVVRTWSPGDGVTRYRFFVGIRDPKSQTYHGPKDGIYTALGSGLAAAFIAGYRSCIAWGN